MARTSCVWPAPAPWQALEAQSGVVQCRLRATGSAVPALRMSPKPDACLDHRGRVRMERQIPASLCSDASPKRLSSPEIFETGWLWAQPWRNHVDCQRSYKTPAPLMSCAQKKLSSRLDGCRHYNLDNLARPSFEVATDQAKPHPHHTTQPSGRGVID